MKGSKTRSQRRMERKQAVVLLVLALVVSLASFTLGVIVGRQGAERDLAQRQPEPRRIMVAEAPSVQTAPAPVAANAAKTVEEELGEEKLTFYSDLSRGETAPLGSGINLPPAGSTPAPQPAPAVADKTAEVVAAVQAAAPAVSPAEAQAEASGGAPEVVPDGSYAVQVGSFASADDAGKLKQKLVGKGYPAFIVEADLGSKGLWYRVRLGPYADAAAAKQMLQLAAEKERIKGFVSRL